MDNLDQFVDQFSGYSESYWFYDNTIEIVFDKSEHSYKLVQGEELIEVPSVTTILKKCLDKSEVLINWGVKMMGQKLISLVPPFPTTIEELESLINQSKRAHKEKLDDAGTVGNLAHNWLENYIQGQIDSNNNPMITYCPPELPTDERAVSCISAALNWMKNHRIRWQKTERKIYSKLHGYAGTMDGLCLVDSCSDLLCCPEPFKDRLSIADWKTGNSLWVEMNLQTAAYLNAYVEETSEPVVDRWIIRLGKEDGQFQTWHTNTETLDTDLFGFLNALRLYKSLEIVEDRIKSQKDERKIEAKLKKEENYKVQCKKFSTYKGKRYPRCNGGEPCIACLNKYRETHAKGLY
jgi:hypothetical protein